MRNKTSLAEAMSQATKKDTTAKQDRSEDSHQEVKKIIITLTAEAHYQLKKLALEERSNIQKLGKEALNDLFVKYKQPPIV
jgi:hypothetical protein